MSKNKNVYLATFDGANIAQPRNYRVSVEYQTIEDSAGPDPAISSSDPVRGRGAVQIAFADHDAAVTLLGKLKTEGTLTLQTQVLSTNAVKTLTINNCRLIGIVFDAVHADASAHIATFVIRTTDGATFDITGA